MGTIALLQEGEMLIIYQRRRLQEAFPAMHPAKKGNELPNTRKDRKVEVWLFF